MPICFATGDFITWVGTIVFEGDAHEFGIAYAPLSPAPDPFKRANHFADEWMIYAEPLTGDDGCPGADDTVVMRGVDKGVDRNLKSTANGRVEVVLDTELFDESLEGRQVHWSGVTDPSGFPGVLTFEGPFRIN